MAEPSTDQPQTTSVEPTEPRRSGAGTSLLWLFAALVIYILSIGPVFKLDQTLNITKHRPSLGHGVEVIYWPVIWLTNNSSLFGQFMNWYLVELWDFKFD
jgi:hypothetical protein